MTNASAGDTINVSAGSATWTTTLTITKNISLIGAGIGNTVITSGVSGFLISWNPTNNAKLFRVSGFTFNLNGQEGIRMNNGTLYPPVYLVRIDHNRFANNTVNGQAIESWSVFGVIDSNTFDTISYPLRIGWGTGGGSWNWANFPELVWGTPNNNIYVEDNTFTGVLHAVSDQDEGGRYVFRYNAFGGQGTEHYPWMDIHGGRGSLRGGMGAEVYGNTFSDYGYLMSHRGGRLAFFYNSAKLGGTYHPYNNDGCPTETKEQMNNSYIFRNRTGLTGALTVDSSGGSTCPGDIVENQDYYMDASPFTGTVGVGAGTLAARPATCTTGVGYWATNQSITDLTGMVGPNPSAPISGTLYKCTATNTWTPWYIPLVYPHPLRTIDFASGSPQAPGNLRVN